MLKNMKPRERMLMMGTVAAVVIFAVFQFGLLDNVGGSTGAGAGDAAREEKLFKQNLRSLESIYDVRYRYSRIGQIPSAENKELPPTLAFTSEVYDISQKLGFQFPPIRATAEDIEGVEDYQLLSVGIKTQGTFADTVKLLRSYEDAGLIFRDVDLRSARDRDVIESSIVVSRIAERPARRTTRRPTR
ncbi:hypothetical protein GC173_04045 [bacterium]|nr:hypothetical protein [bacterium]